MKVNFYTLKKRLLQTFIYLGIGITFPKVMGQVENVLNYQINKEYEEILSDFSALLKSLGITDPVSIFNYYNYTLDQGYLSYQHQYEYSLDRRVSFDHYGLDCILGEGVCLNEAGMLMDLYEAFGYDSYIISCYADIAEVEGRNLIEKWYQKIMGNHAITCVQYEDQCMFFDPTNNCYLEKTDWNKLTVLNTDIDFTIKYFSSIILDDIKSIKVVLEEEQNLEKKDQQPLYIFIDELEKFYTGQSLKYESIYENYEKSSFITLQIFLLILVGKLLLKIIKYQCILYNKKITNDYCALLDNLADFLDKHQIKEDYDIIYQLSHMIDKGYLTYQKGKEKCHISRIKKFQLFQGVHCILNKKDHKLELIKDILEIYSYDSVIMKTWHKKNKRKITPIICTKKNNCFYFYDCEKDLLLCKCKENELSSLDKRYRYIIDASGFKKMEHYQSQKQELLSITEKRKKLLSKEQYEAFYQENEELMKSIVQEFKVKKIK